MNTFIIAGSFNPFTLGHMYLVQESLKIADRVVIATGINPGKADSLPEAIRQKIMVQTLNRNLTPHQLAKVEYDVIGKQDLTAELVQRWTNNGGQATLVRGLRDGMDLAYERNLERINKIINPELGVVYFATPDKLAHVSSSNVRHLLNFANRESVNTTLLTMVDPCVLDLLT